MLSIPFDTHTVTVPESLDKHEYGTLDVDWAVDKSHRQSVSGMAIYLTGAHVIFRSRFQQTVSHSSTESKFVAAADVGK